MRRSIIKGVNLIFIDNQVIMVLFLLYLTLKL